MKWHMFHVLTNFKWARKPKQNDIYVNKHGDHIRISSRTHKPGYMPWIEFHYIYPDQFGYTRWVPENIFLYQNWTLKFEAL